MHLFLESTIVMRTWSGHIASGRQNYALHIMRSLNVSAWSCLRVHTEPLMLWLSVRFLWLIAH